MKNYKMWIGGKFVNAKSGKTYAVVNPATEEKIADVPLGDKADVDKAVEAAKKAFPIWSKKPQSERSKILMQIASAIRAHSKELGEIETLDNGVPMQYSEWLMLAAAEKFDFAAHASRALTGDVIPLKADYVVYTQREPIGVCALITPWNVPLKAVATKLAFALAVGNTCVVKPPSIDSLSTLRLAEILNEIGLPPGTVNIITGPGNTVGNALSTHHDVGKVGFTGSSETGKNIMSCSSDTVKRVALELGGKNPWIVLEDADIDTTVDKAVFASFLLSGQVCASPGRYYLHSKIHDDFVQKFVEATKKVVVGDPMDMKTSMGPLVSADQRDKVEGYIKSGIEEGAELIIGGKRPSKPPFNKGYWVVPTVFTNVAQNMRIAREEVFGPIVCIMKAFSSGEEVIELANDNAYGLSASIWTKNIGKGIKMANELRAGLVWTNDWGTIDPELPWGGIRDSGIGRDNSIYALYEYTELKTIQADLSGLNLNK